MRGVVLSGQEREEISRGLASGRSCRVIAAGLGRHHRVVARVVSRHGGWVAYRAGAAQERSEVARSRPKERKLCVDGVLTSFVEYGLEQRWSPAQISARLREEFSDSDTMRVLAPTIYETLYVQTRGQLRTQLKGELRRGGTRRVSRAERTVAREAKTKVIPNMVMISDRPGEVQDRAVPGHWEGDLICGSRNQSAIITLVERSTRYVLLGKLNYDHKAWRVAAVLTRLMHSTPVHLARALTWDQGREMAMHETFTIATDIPVFFCDPHSPWQRRSNENTNGLVRQYFPKGTDLSIHSNAHLAAVAAELNGRPRQTLNWKTPAEELAKLLEINGGALTA